ncbi:MAG: HAMP domain-containing sensor histidine kinase [Gammaproteobacteria bacterium]|nr:HAMP domain-containing sensor histidine kinase [Gammaproteobacteria bacterium]
MDVSTQPDQNHRILQIYNIYRVILALVLMATFLTSPTTTQLGSHDPDLFHDILIAYGIFSVLVIALIRPGQDIRARQSLLSSVFIADILAIALIAYSCGGMVSGLGLLHLVTIAAGSILIIGRMSTFLAAIASIATIYAEVYLSFSTDVVANQYMQAGLLGILLFATSLYLQSLSERMRRSALLAAEQATSIVNLEQLNQLVIQRMRTGIVVVDVNARVLTANDAAIQMLGLIDTEGGRLSNGSSATRQTLPPVLQQHLLSWRSRPGRRVPTFATNSAAPQLQANFAYLNPASESNIVIFLEDSTQIIQRVRQMKLASLGRLTASIAHEIRNPLGAISHASQLLQEAEGLQQADRRLLEIILNHCGRVNLIIEDVLHMSRHKQDGSERINLLDWLTRFVDNYCESHQLNGQISIDIFPPTTEIRVIVSQLEQILTNLMENGLRYSEQTTGKATLQLKGGLGRNAELSTPVLHVIDEGPGVSAEAEEHLFEPFYTTNPNGTGLGLYISKELCEANQAQLSYHKTSKGKSCFTIHFSHADRNMD